MARVTVVMNRVAVDHFKGWQGPVGKSVDRLANMIANTQRAYAPRRTGKLFATIRVGAHGRWARGIRVNVGANPPAIGGGSKRGYSYMTNEGTRPHVIRARNPSGLLKFYWVKVGATVHFRSVNHPGTRGTHWADRGMAVAMRAWSA